VVAEKYRQIMPIKKTNDVYRKKSPQTTGECLDDGREDSGMAEAFDKQKGICKELQHDTGHA
jgi:hypothetical protein